ncbi:hypothetical protein LCGC14_1145500 [marine sediment metagenome]|uniref:Uncharacterized protein n=1 Tax=marine sediment metagenome TaxID=412755 RepID=A0A0F9M1U0_9ZZZZ
MEEPREYRLLITHRYSARWASRFNKVEALNDRGEVVETTRFVVPDSLILCDLCNKSFPPESDTEVPILQHRWGPDKPWTDVGTRCSDCQGELEDIPRVDES